MLVRRAATWVSTALVALVVALVLPVSQLRIVVVIASCCCPDPDDCHCPDHDTDTGEAPTIKQCHRSADTLESAAAPAPLLVARDVLVPARAAVVLHHPLSAPHSTPILERPRGPS